MTEIVALGVANSGKSALLSALADSLGLFPEGDTPGVTKRVRRQRLGELVLVDTPGIDVSEKHSGSAFGASSRAQVVLWCHSLRIGELRPLEIETLGELLPFGPRIVFALTHADDVAGVHQIESVSAEISKQLEMALRMRFRPVTFRSSRPPSGPDKRRPFNVVGVKRYWRFKDAVSGDAFRTLQNSGIPRLRTFLASRGHMEVAR